MTEIIKCMLASGVTDYNKITWPKLISKKYDGIRCIINNGVVYSRSGKPIRSKVVQELFGRQDMNMLDGRITEEEVLRCAKSGKTPSRCSGETWGLRGNLDLH